MQVALQLLRNCHASRGKRAIRKAFDVRSRRNGRCIEVTARCR
jgi:hypothetical protein